MFISLFPSLTTILDASVQWPMFFSDLLQYADRGVKLSIELYLRVLMAIDEEVVDRQIIHTQEVRLLSTNMIYYMCQNCMFSNFILEVG